MRINSVLTLTPIKYFWPDASLEPSLEIVMQDTSSEWPSRKASLSVVRFFNTMNDPSGYTMYFPQGV